MLEAISESFGRFFMMSSPFLTAWPTFASAFQAAPHDDPSAVSSEPREIIERMRSSLQGPLQTVGDAIRGEWAARHPASRQIQQLEIDLMASLSLLTEDLVAKQREGSALHCKGVLRMARQVHLLGEELFSVLSAPAETNRYAQGLEPGTSSAHTVDSEPLVEVQLGPNTPLVGTLQEVRPRCPKASCTLL